MLDLPIDGPSAHPLSLGAHAKNLLQVSAAALMLTGCMTSHVRKAEVAPPLAYEAPTPRSDDLTQGALERWWTLYDDPQLNDLVDEALRNAPDAKTALAVLAQAAATRSETLARLNIPTGQLQGSATRTQTSIIGAPSNSLGEVFAQPGGTESYSANFDVSWELDLFGRRAAGEKGADADFYNAAFTYEASRTSLIANVANSLFQARGLALQLQDARETARIDRELARLSSVKQQAGLVAGADVDQSLAQAEAADASVESYRAQLLAAQRSLLVLIGHGFDTVETLPASPVVGAPPSIPATVPGDLLRRRPDVRAAEWRIVSAAATLKTDDLALLPTINLQPGLSLSKSTGPVGSTSFAWSIGAGLLVPILDRPRLIAEIHVQRAVAEQDVIAYEKAVQTAYGDVETAFTYLQSDGLRVSMLSEAQAHAGAAYEKAKTGYARGLNDLTTVLQAESTWRNTRNQLTSARITQLERSVQAFKALGGGWSPDEPAATTPYAAAAARGVGEAREVR
jgi:NodT family efflux transporter outer membrane factor (OMF) lipoprotein